MKNVSLLLLVFLLPWSLFAAPVPYSGKVAINGANFQGEAPFTFALRDADGTVHWRNGVDADSSVTLNVDRGLYVCLLGGSTMNDFPPSLFIENSPLFLVVHFFRPDTGEWLHLQPDQLITSAPHALAAEVARNALTADAVKPGAITKSMLAADVLADLNASVVLPEQNATIQTGSITRSMLAPGVLSDLNATIVPGSITAGQLAPALLADLNRSVVITRSMLPASVLADLNRTLSRTDLPADVLADLNRTIAITRDMLPDSVLADLNSTVVITRDMLPTDVLADLNATPIQSGSITAGMLSPDLLADLNASGVATIAPGSITAGLLAPGLLDQNVTIALGSVTKAMLAADVLADLNASNSSSIQSRSISLNENNATVFSFLASDPDGDAIAYSLSGPDASSFNLNVATGEIAFASSPDFENPSDTERDNIYALNLTASDGNASASIALSIRVNDLQDTNTTNPSLSFDGINDFAISAEKSSSFFQAGQSYTLELWFKTSSGGKPYPDGEVFLLGNYDRGSSGGGTTGITEIGIHSSNASNPGKTFFSASGLESSLVSSTRIDDNEWHHIAGVYDRTNQKAYLFVDGALEAQTNILNPADYGNTTNKIRVGGIRAIIATTRYIAGSIGSTRISKTVRYSNNFSPKASYVNDSNATGLWNVNEGAGNVLNDISGNNYHITINGAVWQNVGPQELTSTNRNAAPAFDPVPTVLPADSITLDKLSPQVRSDLNGTISRSRLPADVLADLNKTITRGDLPTDVLADLNRTVTATDIAANTITTAKLSETILKYLRPEITTSPQAPGLIFGGQTVTLASQTEGKYLTHQWNRNDQSIAGATNPTITIVDFNGTLHDGNYTLVVSNDFGSVTSSTTSLQVDATTHVVDLNATVAMEMLWVSPGTFTMGSPTSEADRGTDENETQVTLTRGFYLGKYEVTQAQYEAVMTGNTNSLSATPSEYSGNDRPVETVSWDDVQIFLTRLNAAEQAAGRLPHGWQYALPTEAEWEYACRAGTTTVYSWGDSIATSNANYNNNIGQTRDVGQYAANPWGFFDMHGNVWEWTADWYQSAYPSGTATDPTGPASGWARVFRGGGWFDAGTNLRSASRPFTSPGARISAFGFRVGCKFTGVHTVTSASNMEMLWVSPGTFTMGSPASEAGRGTNPNEAEHNVILTKGFYLGKYEVTQAQYEAVMTGNTNSLSATPSQFTGNDRPVEKVSWSDVQVFLTRLNAAEQVAGRLPHGWEYALPTEAQWEYACRAGTTTAYSWGNDINASHANWNHGADPNQTVDVGQYAANPWGFFDMHGNVLEWTANMNGSAYPTGTVTDPTGPAVGALRAIRGGSWGGSEPNLRSAERNSYTPATRPNFLGFRVGFKASQ